MELDIQYYMIIKDIMEFMIGFYNWKKIVLQIVSINR